MYNKSMEETVDIEQKIAEIEAELSNLDHRRGQMIDELTQLRQLSFKKNFSAQLSLHLQEVSLNNQSPQEEKIQLFRSLFKGREDVFPHRFVATNG